MLMGIRAVGAPAGAPLLEHSPVVARGGQEGGILSAAPSPCPCCGGVRATSGARGAESAWRRRGAARQSPPPGAGCRGPACHAHFISQRAISRQASARRLRRQPAQGLHHGKSSVIQSISTSCMHMHTLYNLVARDILHFSFITHLYMQRRGGGGVKRVGQGCGNRPNKI